MAFSVTSNLTPFHALFSVLRLTVVFFFGRDDAVQRMLAEGGAASGLPHRQRSALTTACRCARCNLPPS